MRTWKLAKKADSTTVGNIVDFANTGDRMWHVLWAHITLATSDSAGNRQLIMQIIDSDATVEAEFRAGAVQAASLTRYYQFGPGLDDMTGFRDTDYLSITLPPTVIIESGQTVRFIENSSVDTSSDNLDVYMHIAHTGEKAKSAR